MEKRIFTFKKHMQILNQTLHEFIPHNLQMINFNHDGMVKTTTIQLHK
jgi:hypothetical protein